MEYIRNKIIFGYNSIALNIATELNNITYKLKKKSVF